MSCSQVGVIIIGMVFASIKHTRVQFIVLLVSQVLFIALMATVTPHTASRAIGFVVMASLALGAFHIVAVLGIQYCAHDRDIGVATGYSSFLLPSSLLPPLPLHSPNEPPGGCP